DVDAAQHEREHQHNVADDDDCEATGEAEFRGKDQEAEADGKMWNNERRNQDRLNKSFESELVAVDRECKSGTDDKRGARRPQRHNCAVTETGAEVFVFDSFHKPSP